MAKLLKKDEIDDEKELNDFNSLDKTPADIIKEADVQHQQMIVFPEPKDNDDVLRDKFLGH